MKVSVVIPVFNAEAYLHQAVLSALQQPETGEILLIEDGSPDGCLALCRQLAQEHASVRVLQHADKRNHGAGASRNLGIREATFPFIAFLDADDFYLPARFSAADQLLEIDPRADGVYDATGVHFENEAVMTAWQSNPLHRGRTITTITAVLQPQELFEALVLNTRGSFTTDAIVVRRRIFDSTGLFDEGLKLHQDTAMWIKMAAVGRLLPGSLEKPVAMRRVHSNNRIAAVSSGYSTARKELDETLCKWANSVNLPKSLARLLQYRRWRNRLYGYDIEGRRIVLSPEPTFSLAIRKRLTYFIRRTIAEPSLFFSPNFCLFCLKAVRRLLENLNSSEKPACVRHN